ncbi:MAG: Stf0 family sulfotransferase, partial [Xenococcaceae cyanobacterium MO_188.B19]|nr:Stf0 family sulfotransferase [Xenococcaceae cyanobacterium MO_188.B19]
QSYIVCSTGRSGSTLLCKTLKNLKCCGNPAEYFHHNETKKLQLKDDPDKFISYCDSVLQEGLTANGVFGVKMHWWQMYDFIKIAKKSALFKDKKDLEILNAIFPNLKFIYISRQDIIAQAVSTTIALATKVWEKSADNNNNQEITGLSPQKISIKFQPLKIYRWEQSFKDQNRRWQKFFEENGLDYYELTYEKLTSSFEQEIVNILNFLDIDQTLVFQKIEMATKKQSNNINQKFIKYYKMFPKLLLKVLYKINHYRDRSIKME